MGGVAKGLLHIQGQRIIDRQLAVLRPLFARVFLVANDVLAYGGLSLEVYCDEPGPGHGPIAGLETALMSLTASESAVVCLAADMPFVTTSALLLVRDAEPGAAVVAPVVGGFPEPLCARYSKSTLAMVRAARAMQRYKMMDLLSQLDAHLLDAAALGPDADGRFATNVNTPADLLHAQLKA